LHLMWRFFCRGGAQTAEARSWPPWRTTTTNSAGEAAAACSAVRATSDEDDGVDGPCSPASMCDNVVVAERHNERNRPPCKLPRSAWISRSECFKFTVSTAPARLLFGGS
jgi:hypothetical protein